MKQEKAASAATKSFSMQANATTKSSEQSGDAVALLKADHRKVEKLFKDYETAGQDTAKKARIARQICLELIIHTHLEEEIFYPACRARDVEEDALDKAQVEHDGAKVMIADLLNGEPDDRFYDAKVTVLKEYIRHHVNEEEKPRDGILAQAKKVDLDLNALGQRLQARKAELQSEGDALTEETLKAPSIHLQNIESTSEEPMSQYGPQRGRYEDERYRTQARQTTGRSYMQMDEEDHGSDGIGQQARDRAWYERDDDRYATGQDYRSTREDYGPRSGRSRPRDDDEGYSSRRRWTSRYGRVYGEDEERSARGRGQQRDRDQQSYGGGRSRYEEDEDRGYQGRGQERERDEYGRFMSEDEEDYGSRGSGRGRQGSSWSRGERSSGSRGGQEQRRWYGDHRGHSQAAKRGWQHRD